MRRVEILFGARARIRAKTNATEIIPFLAHTKQQSRRVPTSFFLKGLVEAFQERGSGYPIGRPNTEWDQVYES